MHFISVLLRRLHLTSSGIRSQRRGTLALEHLDAAGLRTGHLQAHTHLPTGKGINTIETFKNTFDCDHRKKLMFISQPSSHTRVIYLCVYVKLKQFLSLLYMTHTDSVILLFVFVLLLSNYFIDIISHCGSYHRAAGKRSTGPLTGLACLCQSGPGWAPVHLPLTFLPFAPGFPVGQAQGP